MDEIFLVLKVEFFFFFWLAIAMVMRKVSSSSVRGFFFVIRKDIAVDVTSIISMI